MDSLERITLDGCAAVTNTGLAHLARLPRLRELRVSGPQITPDIASFPVPGSRSLFALRVDTWILAILTMPCESSVREGEFLIHGG